MEVIYLYFVETPKLVNLRCICWEVSSKGNIRQCWEDDLAVNYIVETLWYICLTQTFSIYQEMQNEPSQGRIKGQWFNRESQAQFETMIESSLGRT